MNIYLIALLVVFVYSVIAFIAAYATRLSALEKMNNLLSQAQKCADKGQALINEHGNTIGELTRAGVYPQLKGFESDGGEYYRKAVLLASSLARWPFGLVLGKEKMQKGYDTVGYFTKGRGGSLEAFEDVQRGFANDTGYYFPQHLHGLVASLRTVGLFG